jgi:hypothetical protein
MEGVKLIPGLHCRLLNVRLWESRDRIRPPREAVGAPAGGALGRNRPCGPQDVAASEKVGAARLAIMWAAENSLTLSS